MTETPKKSKKREVLEDYVVWKIKHGENVLQKYLDELGDDLPEILKRLKK